MVKCEACRSGVPRGSKYCPRCGTVIDDGMNRRGRFAVVLIAMFVGIALLIILFGLMFSGLTPRH